MTPKWSEFSVYQLMKNVETTFAESAREKGLKLRIVPCGLWVRSDYVLLSRIISNLVANAIRYTATGKVLVGCRRRGGEVRIEVWDTGRGIPRDQLQNVFTEFFRIGGSENEQQNGLGLGLAIVDRLGRLLKHSVVASSELGKGSCFSVSVPTVAPGEEIKTSLPIQSLRNATLGKLVLVIDNDPLVLEGMCGVIKNWGCNVVTANSEQAALVALGEDHKTPDVIISDYHLSGERTGIQAIAEVRRVLAAPIPGLLMTADTNAEPKQQAQACGFMILHKPINPMALRASLSQILKRNDRV
jgi:CheY-like chemotaxis protein